MEQTNINPNYLQAIEREQLRYPSTKEEFCKYEKHQHESLQIALKAFFIFSLVNPAPVIHIISLPLHLRQLKKQLDEEDKNAQFTVLLAYLNMPKYKTSSIKTRAIQLPQVFF